MQAFLYFVGFFMFFMFTLFTSKYNNLYLQSIAYFIIAMAIMIIKRVYFPDNLYFLLVGYTIIGVAIVKLIQKDMSCIIDFYDVFFYMLYLFVFGASMIDVFMVIFYDFEIMPSISFVLTVCVFVAQIYIFYRHRCYNIVYLSGIAVLVVANYYNMYYLSYRNYQIIPLFVHMLLTVGLVLLVCGLLFKMRKQKQCKKKR